MKLDIIHIANRTNMTLLSLPAVSSSRLNSKWRWTSERKAASPWNPSSSEAPLTAKSRRAKWCASTPAALAGPTLR